ncbi:hypothetical protein MKW92_016253 [Papaver armeniacum]|nr:hypothetical protein MKW92_016253 [Papaver armeniacum]
MKKLNVWETLRISYNHGSKRNGILTSILHGSGFVLGGSVLILAVVSFMFPSIFATLVLKNNNLDRYYLRFSSPHSQKSSSNVTASSVLPIDLLGKLVVTEDNLVPTLSTNFSSHSNSSSTKAYDQKQRNEGNVDSLGAGDCNIFEGEWVMANDSKLHYPPGSCPYLKHQQSFDCHSNGRLDDKYLKWQWQWQSHPTNAGCIDNIPRFLNATDFLERLRGKKLVFAGDSLNRNMYTSMVCIFWSVIPDKSRIVRTGGDFTTVYKASLDYNCTVAFVHTAFLVNHLGVHTPEKETLRLDLIDEASSSRYRDADIVVFDSWHWWGDDKTHYGINFFQEGNYLYPKLDINKAFKKALTTWRKWIDRNIDSNKTQVVFRGFSLVHFHGGKWNTGGGCNLETEPIPRNETYVKPSPIQWEILENTLRRMKTNVLYMNISKLTYYRADAHPSVYGKVYTTQERLKAHQDCSHWCLPGVPDTWNELLYATLLKAVISFMFPSSFPFLTNPVLQNKLDKCYAKFTFPHWQYYLSASSINPTTSNIFEGEWVMVTDRKQYYPPGSCPYLEREHAFDCYSYGRPDNDFFNATDFLERLRGKKLVFAGDSLNRNMYMSMVCILWNVIPDKSRIVRPSGDYTVTYKVRHDYNCTIAFVWSAFLVTQRKLLKPEQETLRLDLIDDGAASAYRDADILVFNSCHWWVGEKLTKGMIKFFQEGDYLYPELDINKAYGKALTTWSKWIDANVDSKKTQVVFRGISLTHFAGGCKLATKPIPSNRTYIKPFALQSKILEDTLRRMKTPVLFLNISKLTYYRVDAHPSVYVKKYKNYTTRERNSAPQDCLHWCLPGVPDTWNELLYATLLQSGKGSFGN